MSGNFFIEPYYHYSVCNPVSVDNIIPTATFIVILKEERPANMPYKLILLETARKLAEQHDFDGAGPEGSHSLPGGFSGKEVRAQDRRLGIAG